MKTTLKTTLKTKFQSLRARITARKLVAYAAATAIPATALASQTGTMPWDSTLQAIQSDLSGPVAVTLLLIAIVTTGLMLTFGEHGASMRKLLGIAAGGSIALLASSFITGLGLTAGALIH